MTNHKKTECTSFAGSRMIATGNLLDVAVQTKQSIDAGESETILIFDDSTSNLIEIDLRGQVEALKIRLNQHSDSATDSIDSSPRGRGRPKLGVVAREVTLLPRHWEWLNHQPGGASVALRKLVEEAKRANVYKDERREAQESTYKFMSAMAGNLAGFEEATRALFAADSTLFFQKNRKLAARHNHSSQKDFNEGVGFAAISKLIATLCVMEENIRRFPMDEDVMRN